MMRALALAAALLATANAYPSHYHSCTFNFTGGERLPFPFCAYQRSEPAAARALFRAGQQLRCTEAWLTHCCTDARVSSQATPRCRPLSASRIYSHA
jgi:hypothetical protein